MVTSAGWRFGLCPSCQEAYGKGAFWGGLIIALIAGAIKLWS